MSLSGQKPEKLIDAVEEFLVYQTAVRNLSPATIRGYKYDIELMEHYLPQKRMLAEITTTDLRSCIGKLARSKKAPASINRFIAAIRTLFAYCYRLSYIESNPALELRTVKNPVKIPRFMTEDEVSALCEEPEVKELLWEARDHAIFEMLYSSGCRVSELASLKLSDFNSDYSAAVVRGKGGKDRYVFFTEKAVSALKTYILERNMRVNKEHVIKQVFINKKGKALTDRGIRWITNRYSSVEGTNKPVSPHAFRHTFATELLNNGADIRIVQELLGHSSISTTQRYTHITASKLIETYNRAHPHGKE